MNGQTTIKNCLHLRSIWKSIVWMILLSAAYNAAYLALFALSSDIKVQYFTLAFIMLISAIGMYLILGFAFNNHFTLLPSGGLVWILLLESFWLFLFYGILTPLYAMKNDIAMAVSQTLSLLTILAWGPVTILWMRAISLGNVTWKSIIRFVQAGLKTPGLWIGCVAILLTMCVVDTLTDGIFSLASGLSAYYILSVILFQGSCMTSTVMWTILGQPAQAILATLTGFAYAWLECCFLAWAGKKFHGTEQT